jgi:hypothetical protein
MRRGPLVAVGVPAFLLGVILAAHRPLLGMIVRQRAAAMGVELDWDAIDPSFGEIRLSRASVGLSGVHGVKVTAASVRLGTRGLSVASVDAEGVGVTIEGPAGDRVLELASWSGEHADTYRLRGAATGVRLDWRARPGSPAWLTMTGGSLDADGANARFTATSTSAFGVPLGTVGASFAVEASGVTIEVGKRSGAEAPVVARLASSARPPTLALTLRPVELAALGTAFGLSLPAPGALASGRADLTLARGGVTGTASLDLDGWVPPHPRVLDGVVTGKKTAIKSHLRFSEDRATLKLEDLEVRAGRLDLKGSGSIADEAHHAMVRLDLAGPIPCADLARAAGQELGGLLGGLAAELGSGMIGGSATVNVSVEADARDLGAAKVKPRVGMGCGLKLPGL